MEDYMRHFILGLAAVSMLQGCSTISREAGYPGGNIGYLADRHTLFAKGQDQRVNRYLVMLALLTPLVAETVETSGEARLSAERIKVLYQDIEKLEAASKLCALPSDLKEKPPIERITTGNCDEGTAATKEGTAHSFESLSYDVTKSLHGALNQAFDNLEIRSNAKKVIALDPSEILKTLLRARRLIPILHRYLATYRDVALIFGQSVATTCANVKQQTTALPDGCDKVANSFGNLIARTRAADSDIAKDQRPINDVFDAGAAALNKGLDWKLSKVQRISLLQHVNRACGKLDALAQIDDKEFVGCTVDLTGNGNDTPAQNAAIKIISAGENI
jgi:hypothetical protein